MEIQINVPVVNRKLRAIFIAVLILVPLSTLVLNGKAILEWAFPKKTETALFENLASEAQELKQAFQYSKPGCSSGDCYNEKSIYVYSTGDIYSGEFLGGERHGTGIYIYKNDPVFEYYSGKFHMDAKLGEGVFRYKDGSWYKGEVMDKKRHGYGIECNANMELMQEGCWQDNELVKPNGRCE